MKKIFLVLTLLVSGFGFSDVRVFICGYESLGKNFSYEIQITRYHEPYGIIKLTQIIDPEFVVLDNKNNPYKVKGNPVFNAIETLDVRFNDTEIPIPSYVGNVFTMEWWDAYLDLIDSDDSPCKLKVEGVWLWKRYLKGVKDAYQ